MTTLTHKGHSRLYCEKEEHIQLIKDILKKYDEYEYEYMPDNWITTFDNYPNVVYTGKFSDLDIAEFTALCWKQDIKVWIFDSGSNDFPLSKINSLKKR